jgi:hypothetical protein
MAGLSKTLKIGVIAEETNDIEVLYELTSKIIRENSFSFKHFIGHGCGTLRRKCRPWAYDLMQRGCTLLVVIHDLDKRDESELRTDLEGKIEGLEFRRSLVLIPIEEIEAWLLSDPNAIKSVFNMRKLPSIPSQPERISDPKEFLSALVMQNSKSRYLNTIHNRQIAAELVIESLKSRCPSFSRYPEFLSAASKKKQKTR